MIQSNRYDQFQNNPQQTKKLGLQKTLGKIIVRQSAEILAWTKTFYYEQIHGPLTEETMQQTKQPPIPQTNGQQKTASLSYNEPVTLT